MLFSMLLPLQRASAPLRTSYSSIVRRLRNSDDAVFIRIRFKGSGRGPPERQGRPELQALSNSLQLTSI